MTGIRPRQWVAVHRKHHAFTDVAGDPHSPVLVGFWRVQLANAALVPQGGPRRHHDAALRQGSPPGPLGHVVVRPRLRRARHRNHPAVSHLGLAPRPARRRSSRSQLSGAERAPSTPSVTASGPRAMPTRRSTTNGSRFVTGGEGLHNNHHAAPTSAKLALGRHEFDPGWWVIWSWCGRRLATVRLGETRLVNRAATSTNRLTRPGVAERRLRPMADADLEQLCVNVVRGLAMDAPQRAGNGHPGTAMALAPLAHVLFSRVLRHDPTEPDWPDRDSFILSNGHASILLVLDVVPQRLRGRASRTSSSSASGDPATPGHPEVHGPLPASRSRPGLSVRDSSTGWAWRSPSVSFVPTSGPD